jgi:hypothetical protein
VWDRLQEQGLDELIEERERKGGNTMMTTTTLRVIAGPCVTPIINGDVARVVELAAGGLRIEWWVKGIGRVTAPDGAFTLDEFVPGGGARPVLPKDAVRLGCRLEDFGRRWTEETASPRRRAKIIRALKERAWDLAARQVPPGTA